MGRTHTDIPQLGSIQLGQAPLIISTGKAAAQGCEGDVERDPDAAGSAERTSAAPYPCRSVASLCSGYFEALDNLDRFTWKDREMRMVLEKAGGSLVRIRFDDDVAGEAISSSLEA